MNEPILTAHEGHTRYENDDSYGSQDMVQRDQASKQRQSLAKGLSHSRTSTFSVMEQHQKSKEAQAGMKGTFVDANAMKEKVRQNLSKPQYNVKDMYKEVGLWQAMARSALFEYASLSVVAGNALWIAVDTDLNKSELLLEAHPVFQVAEHSFCFCFFFEWLVRYMSFRRKRDGCRDGWFMFDSILVWMMVLETWFMTAILLLSGSGSDGAGNAGVMRLARLLRLSRMARMARLLRVLPELMIMIRGMMAATRSVFFTLCLLLIVLYVFAIAFTQMTVNTDIGSRYFSTVPEAMFTLLIFGTLLDNVGQISRELVKEQPVIAALFGVFVLIAALTVMNMLIGVLCEVVNAVAATEKEEMLVSYVNQKLQRVVSLLDADGGGTISKKEFMQILENMDAVRCLQDVGVDVIGLVDFAEVIFSTDDIDDGGGEQAEVELDFGKFMEVVLQLRGTNNATVKDIVDLRKFVRSSIIDMKGQLAKIIISTEAIQKGSRSDKSSQQVRGASMATSDLSDQPRRYSSDQNWSNDLSLSPKVSSKYTDSLSLSNAKFERLEESSAPLPLNFTTPVLLLRPPELAEQSPTETWPHSDTGDIKFSEGIKRNTPLDGQWYPFETAEVQLRTLRKPEVVMNRRPQELNDLGSTLADLPQRAEGFERLDVHMSAAQKSERAVHTGDLTNTIGASQQMWPT